MTLPKLLQTVNGRYIPFRLKRVSPGNYLVNERYEVNRTHEGALHAGETSWYWRDAQHKNTRGRLQNTKAEAVADLQDYLKFWG